MYDAISFFGSPKELLAFTHSLRMAELYELTQRAAELLDKSYEQNVHPNQAT